MKIAWIKKTTVLDYPDHIACIVFTSWCNLRCQFCYNPEFIAWSSRDLIDEGAFFNFLESRKWLLDWVVICWGEPTIQNDLFDFCDKIKSYWFLIKLDTNWQNPTALARLIDANMVDYIAMDIKDDKYLTWESQLVWVSTKPKDYLQSIEIIMKSPIDYEFRTTVISWYHDKESITNICKVISWAKQYSLQNFIGWHTLVNNESYCSFTYQEMDEFKAIILKYVKKCNLR